MLISIPFTKMSGAGNDFVVIDNMKLWLNADQSALAKAACSRPFGIGADGLLIIEPSLRADFLMRYYNADGSYGGMCGNGARCVARFAHSNGIAGEELTFEALDYIYHATISHASVDLEMKPINSLKRKELLLDTGVEVSLFELNTGSPHVVIFNDDLQNVDVSKTGRYIRYHPEFSPSGCNVNFIRLVDDDVVEMRTYERGVESETLACGTGAVASAIVARRAVGCQSPISVRARSGEILTVSFLEHEGQFTNILLRGSAHFVYTGTVRYDASKNKVADLVP